MERRAAELLRLRIRTSDVIGLRDVYDVLLDRLDELHSTPTIETEEVGADELSVPGPLVTIEALLATPAAGSASYELTRNSSHHHTPAVLEDDERAVELGRPFLNFAEQQVDSSTFYDAESFTRLRRIRRTVASDGHLLANQQVR